MTTNPNNTNDVGAIILGLLQDVQDVVGKDNEPTFLQFKKIVETNGKENYELLQQWYKNGK